MQLVTFVLFYSGAWILIRAAIASAASNPVIVLFGHRVVDNDDQFARSFGHPCVAEVEEKFAFLRKYFHPITLDQAVQYVVEGKDPGRHAVVVTFDDGYKDNLDNALPIMRKHSIPATLFVATASLDHDRPFPHDVAGAIINQTKKATLDLPFRRVTPGNASVALSAKWLKNGSVEERAERIEQLLVEGGLSLDDLDLPRRCNWDDIRTLISSGLFTIGSHTVDHVLLSRLDEEEVVEQITVSKTRIETECATEVKHFCFPYGHKEDYRDNSDSVLSAHGYRSACTTRHGLNRRGTNPFELRRTVLLAEPLCQFALRISGFFEIFQRD
jgi:peptidoglycan/xylan/chitin deacetylase (PgdA/CDA1 family)